MKKNMGTADRVIRVLFALVVLALWVTGQISGTVALVLGVVAVVFVVTSLMGTCLGYIPFGISTKKEPGPSA